LRDCVPWRRWRRASAAEVVERKGAGHLNAICDASAEPPSRDLCGAYREQFGTLLHHNIE